MPRQIAEEVKDARLQELQALLIQQQTAFNAGLAGQTIPVLFDKPGRYDGQVGGRSPWLQAVHVDGGLDLIGQIVDVSIERGQQNSLSGRLVTAEAAA